MKIKNVYINAKNEPDRLYRLSIKGDRMTPREQAEAARLIAERKLAIREGKWEQWMREAE